MPSFQEKITHAANVASWKIDQQVRLNACLSKIRGTEEQIRAEKIRLADLAMNLASQNTLTAEALQEGITAVQSLYSLIADQQRELDAVRNETGPVLAADAPPQYAPPQYAAPAPYPPPPQNVPSQGGPEQPAGPLVCPNCKTVLEMRFCRECGAEGVPQQG